MHIFFFFFFFFIGGCDILFATEKYYNLLLHCNLRLSISSFLICRLKVRIEVLSLILPSFIILLKTMGPCVNKEFSSIFPPNDGRL